MSFPKVAPTYTSIGCRCRERVPFPKEDGRTVFCACGDSYKMNGKYIDVTTSKPVGEDPCFSVEFST